MPSFPSPTDALTSISPNGAQEVFQLAQNSSSALISTSIDSNSPEERPNPGLETVSNPDSLERTDLLVSKYHPSEDVIGKLPVRQEPEKNLQIISSVFSAYTSDRSNENQIKLIKNAHKLSVHLNRAEAQIAKSDVIQDDDFRFTRMLIRETLIAMTLLGRISSFVSLLTFRVMKVLFRTAIVVLLKLVAYAESREWWVPTAVDMFDQWSSATYNITRMSGQESVQRIYEYYTQLCEAAIPIFASAKASSPKWTGEGMAKIRVWLKKRSLDFKQALESDGPWDDWPSELTPDRVGRESTAAAQVDAGGESAAGRVNLTDTDRPKEEPDTVAGSKSKMLWWAVDNSQSGAVEIESLKSIVERIDATQQRAKQRLEEKLLGLPSKEQMAAELSFRETSSQGQPLRTAAPRRIGARRPLAAEPEPPAADGSALLPLGAVPLIRNVSTMVTRRLVGRSGATLRLVASAWSSVMSGSRGNGTVLSQEGGFNGSNSIDWLDPGKAWGAIVSSPWAANIAGSTAAVTQAATGLWAGALKQLDSLDAGLVTTVESIESQVVRALADVPLLRQAEDVVTSYAKGAADYLKVQRWWHQLLLWTTPKWEAVEKWAKEKKVPEFFQRVYLNAVFYRVRYLRWFVALAAWELLVLRRSAALAAIAAALVSAAIVRSDLSAYRESTGGDGRGAAGLTGDWFRTLSRIGGSDAAAPAATGEGRRRGALKDHANFAALVGVCAVGLAAVWCPFMRLAGPGLLLGHAWLHAAQRRRPPAPKRVFGG